MATQHSHWVPIADLLSGFVVVLLLMFVGSVVLSALERQEEERRVAEARETEEARIERLRAESFSALKSDLRSYEASKVLHVDEVARSIELKDVSFRPGSACLSERASEAIEQVGPRIAAMLTNDPALHVQIEGHTDPVPVGRLKNSCGYFATNTQLAAQRAMNVRGLIVPEALPELRARLPVLGWGPDRLRNTGDQTAAENRRVELRFQWLEVGAPSAGATVGAR